jgi:hypothetical protein
MTVACDEQALATPIKPASDLSIKHWAPGWRLGFFIRGGTSRIERCCSARHLTNREKHDACLSYSHRFAIGPDRTRFGAKCATAATDQSKFRGWDYWTAGKQERTCREVS